ncbi:MAG: chromosome segregation protein [Paucimonas sp.]|nr:chromosome segregation protein [Paucimonas sp.]
MFHIKSLELVHWDYWQRVKNIPLDARIITIAGQNGSGKTTLLDALRTLFGLDCSMGRTYKHYARHSGQQSAWLRAVVDNRPVNRQLSSRPFNQSGFFGDDEVTLFCQIQKNGGDWKRQYLMRGGAVQIEDVQGASDWLGVDAYRRRLASAGLSPAIAKVLALEQGETDKLCEYSPRQLLDLVFQVFGDKEVLDAYEEAKRHQVETEKELQNFERELESAQTSLERLRLRAANYHQWETLNKERRDLREEILPTLQYHEQREKAAEQGRAVTDAGRTLAAQDSQLSGKRADLAERARALDAARQNEAAIDAEKSERQASLDRLNEQIKPLEGLLMQESRLQQLASEAGADVAALAAELASGENTLARQRQQRDDLAARLATVLADIAALEGHTALPEPEPVRAMRRALRDAGIGHAMLSDVIEVQDAAWQGAVEGVLRSYASVVLLQDPKQASAAYRLSEKERYGHFIVPDLVTARVAKDDSLLAAVRFTAPVPAWLVEQLARITRVDSVEAGMKLGSDSEWITPGAYHRERRGGRSLHVDPTRFRFGQAGRNQRLAALQASLPRLEADEDQLTLSIRKLAADVGALKSRVGGVDAAKELVAREAEFAEARRALAPLKAARQEVGARLGELLALAKATTEARAASEWNWSSARDALASAESHLRQARRRQAEERAAHAGRLIKLRQEWRRLPLGWRGLAHRQALTTQYRNAHQVGLRIESLDAALDRDDWEKDDTVVGQHARLASQLANRQAETDDRRYQNNRAIEATANARGAYIERLRNTVRNYGRNIRELGELAGIEVHADPVRLENDDLLLAQAGLHVRFKFDGKGAIGMNDGEASGGQQVMKSLILLIGLLKAEDGGGGFVFIDEPFAHLDIRNIQLVGQFLKNTEAQYLMTTPLTHNTDVYDPSELTLVTSKKKRDDAWAPPIFVLQRRVGKAA